MFTFKTSPNNRITLTHTVYLPYETQKAIIYQKYDTIEEVKGFVISACYYLINIHFDALFKYYNMNRDYIYEQCQKKRVKLSWEDYHYTDKLCNLQVLKDEFHDPASSMYKKARLIVDNSDLLRAIIQGMKIKGGTSLDLLRDLIKEAKTILRNIQ